MSPEHFPIMPLRTRPWSSTVSSGPDHQVEPHTEPPVKRTRTSGEDTPQPDTTGHVAADQPQAALHKCSTCHACFLSLNGLQAHQQTAHETTREEFPVAKRGRPTGADTIATRLRATTTEIPVPIQERPL